MIVIQQEPRRVVVNVYGEFTLADYKEFEDMVNYKVKFEGPVDLLFDLREMIDFTLDVAWEDIVFSRAHADDFTRVVRAHHCDAVGSLNVGKRVADGFFKKVLRAVCLGKARVVHCDKVCEDFGIRLALESVAEGFEGVAKLRVIFYHAVVREDDLAV